MDHPKQFPPGLSFMEAFRLRHPERLIWCRRGPNDEGLPEDMLVEAIIPIGVPDGTILHDQKTGERFGKDGRSLGHRPPTGRVYFQR